MAIVAEALKFPLEELAAQAQALLVAAGDTTPHFFGEKHLAANYAPPRYVWVPSGTVTRKEIATRTRDDFRPLVSSIERIEVHCWGGSFRQAWNLRCNALVAMKRLGQADLVLESGDWLRPAQGWNQAGEVYVLICSLIVPTIDVFVDPSSLTPEIPATPGVVPTGYENGVYVSQDPAILGEQIIEEIPE